MKRFTAVLRLGAATGAALLMMSAYAAAQELEPGAYWPLPTRLNIITVINTLNWGDLAFDPAAPIDEASATIDTVPLVYTRVLSLAGRSVNAGVVVPVIGGHLEGVYLGQPAETSRFGLGDPRIRVAMNVYGAPAMTPQQYASYQWQTIVGVSVSVVPPLGEYDSSKLINLGTNRWSFKTELGFARARGKWVFEAMAGVWWFTDNTNFFGGNTREQDPIMATQFHLTYRFSRQMWLAADTNFFTGGQTTIGGKENLDLQRNSRVGATFSKALNQSSAIRMSVSRGAYTTIGADFNAVSFGYNYAWVR